ncbi:HET-domain-containing protein [Bimuria novae-zelandiae CBS 107.79]|uniref:HET-domain-containing protein n=1 Tax=Bimuria novae-zelandiae CBS 107.79 TaxID=1447943 RepID=A0A6A5UJB8_9PLEO|nr:HET-domain-containing protein [Bimuria novae-zelandiae CBS 107.79]
MSLCQYCSTVPSRIFSTSRNEQGYHDHHQTFEELKASADAGCRGCKLFAYSKEVYKGPYAKGDIDYPGKVRDRYRLASTKFGSQELLFGYSQCGYFRGGCMPEEWRNEQPPPPGSPENELLDYEARLITRWAKLCFEKHDRCGHEMQYLPTRVVDVGTLREPELRLLVTAGLEATDRRYLALSHCWGLTMPPSARTVQSTLEQHLAGVKYDNLPLTFRDFIDIARRLDVRYVWIDSLCIIQDSREDWEHEAAQMAEVYSYSYLTIAASGSANGQGGCRVNPDARSYGPVDIECSYTDAEGATTLYPYRIWARDPNPIQSVLQQNPLNKRGWTVQERELPPRVVHYSHDTIRWECCELSATLEFPCGDHLAFDAGRLFDGGSEARAPQIGLPHNNSKVLEASTKHTLAWFELVQRYTERSLTKQSDILPAMSGIARIIASRSSDRYLAGLWESSLAHCLLWTRSNRQGLSNYKHTRPYPLLAPTWSWASVKGPLEYSPTINGYWHSFNASPNPKYVPQLVEANLVPAGPDPYSTLSSGSLKLRGKVRMAVTTRVVGEGNNKLLALGGGQTMQPIGTLSRDIQLCEECCPVGTTEMLFLMCCMNAPADEAGKIMTTALAIRPEAVDLVLGPDSLRTLQASLHNVLQSFQKVGIAVGIDSSFWDTAFDLTLALV